MASKRRKLTKEKEHSRSGKRNSAQKGTKRTLPNRKKRSKGMVVSKLSLDLQLIKTGRSGKWIEVKRCKKCKHIYLPEDITLGCQTCQTQFAETETLTETPRVKQCIVVGERTDAVETIVARKRLFRDWEVKE